MNDAIIKDRIRLLNLKSQNRMWSNVFDIFTLIWNIFSCIESFVALAASGSTAKETWNVKSYLQWTWSMTSANNGGAGSSLRLAATLFCKNNHFPRNQWSVCKRFSFPTTTYYQERKLVLSTGYGYIDCEVFKEAKTIWTRYGKQFEEIILPLNQFVPTASQDSIYILTFILLIHLIWVMQSKKVVQTQSL